MKGLLSALAVLAALPAVAHIRTESNFVNTLEGWMGDT